ncbi:MAG TPA: hypothetical protein VHD85_20585 [Terracidiphilus sp.]|nr:hypothetical protein [Terracidiphilus sp.]
MKTKSIQVAAIASALAFLAGMPVFVHAEDQPGRGQAVVTVLPQKNATPAAPQQQQISIKVDGKTSSVTGWKPLRGDNSPVELVILIDGAARTSLGSQLGDIQHFVQGLPANASASIAYMMNGRAVLTGPLSTDRAEILRGLHIPSGGSPGISASPYFCLSDLAKHWPSNNPHARREVVMVTDGVDYYDLRYDPQDPYLQAAISDSVRAHLTVYSIYWRSIGRLDHWMGPVDAGQNLLTQLTEATGGTNYWQGYGNPVSLQPYLEDVQRRLNNQYEVSFMAPFKDKPQVESFKFKLDAPGTKVAAPQQVLVMGSESAGGEQ